MVCNSDPPQERTPPSQGCVYWFYCTLTYMEIHVHSTLAMAEVGTCMLKHYFVLTSLLYSLVHAFTCTFFTCNNYSDHFKFPLLPAPPILGGSRRLFAEENATSVALLQGAAVRMNNPLFPHHCPARTPSQPLHPPKRRI